MSNRATRSTAPLVRKQILLTRDQCASLGALAASQSRSEGDLVREALDDWLAKQKAGEVDWKGELRGLRGMWKDRDDLDKHFTERRERRRVRRERMMRVMQAGDE